MKASTQLIAAPQILRQMHVSVRENIVCHLLDLFDVLSYMPGLLTVGCFPNINVILTHLLGLILNTVT